MLEIGLYRYDHVHDDYRHNTYWIAVKEGLIIYNMNVTEVERKFTDSSRPVRLSKNDIITDCFTGVRINGFDKTIKLR